MAILRICFVGDSLIAGTGDDQYVGWPGRLCAAERANGHDVTLYNLGVRGDTSALVAARWRPECIARLPQPYPGAIVFGFGVNDVGEERTGTPRVASDETVRAARAILSEARAWLPTLMIGPAPIDEAKALVTAGPIPRDFRNEKIARASRILAGVAAEAGVPYLDLYSLLGADPAFMRAVTAGDGVHPTAAGYAIMATTIGAWLPWRAWFD